MFRTNPRVGRSGPTLGRLVCLLATLAGVPTASAIEHAFKVDHFGYRPLDQKVAVVSRDPGAQVQVRDSEGHVVFTVPNDGGSIVFQGTDSVRSGDTVWWIDFSGLTRSGTFELFSPALGDSSYPFDIRHDVYDEAAHTALKAFYFQRCNTPKLEEYGGPWADAESCHLEDAAASAATGNVNRGLKNLTGGWHDAGDYNKYVWRAVSDAIWSLLTAFERRPAAFNDDLGIPESGNGLPDVLDEVKWELDWLLKMQLADGSVLERLREDGANFDSPPSVDNRIRYYHDPNLDSGGVFTGSVALAARIFRAEGQTDYANTLEAAANLGWQWLQTQGNNDTKVWAAAELLRLDPSNTSARSYVENYNDWFGQWFEIDAYEWRAASAYLRTGSANATVKAGMESRFNDHVNQIFDWNDSYRAGMADWQYYWGSNRPRALYGLFLLDAAELGQTGTRSIPQTKQHAQDFLHYLHGKNPLNMLYLTNMRELGGEHSSYQAYHGWFGNSPSAYSSSLYFGKPAEVVEEDYPYFKGVDNHGVSDNKISTYGPLPGLVTGGPNNAYGYNGDESTPPANAIYYDRYYRDWADQTIWTARTWEITEPSLSYQGPYVALSYAFADTSPDGVHWEIEPVGNTASSPPNRTATEAVSTEPRQP